MVTRSGDTLASIFLLDFLDALYPGSLVARTSTISMMSTFWKTGRRVNNSAYFSARAGPPMERRASLCSSFVKAAKAPPHRNLFHFLLHPDLPARERSTFNDQTVKAWQAQAARGIRLFKQSNVLYQFEPWYHQLIERFCTLPDFRAYWEQDCEIADQEDGPTKLLLSRHADTAQLLPIKLRHLYLSVGSHRYPSILAFFPLDEAARAVFASLDTAYGSCCNAGDLDFSSCIR